MNTFIFHSRSSEKVYVSKTQSNTQDQRGHFPSHSHFGSVLSRRVYLYKKLPQATEIVGRSGTKKAYIHTVAVVGSVS